MVLSAKIRDLVARVVEELTRKVPDTAGIYDISPSDEFLKAVFMLLTINKPEYLDAAVSVLENQSAEVRVQPWFKGYLEKIKSFQTDTGVIERIERILQLIPAFSMPKPVPPLAPSSVEHGIAV